MNKTGYGNNVLTCQYFVNNFFPTECTGTNPAMPNPMPRISLSDEHRLRQELFSQTNKDRMVRPVLNSSEAVKVKFVGSAEFRRGCGEFYSIR